MNDSFNTKVNVVANIAIIAVLLFCDVTLVKDHWLGVRRLLPPGWRHPDAARFTGGVFIEAAIGQTKRARPG